MVAIIHNFDVISRELVNIIQSYARQAEEDIDRVLNQQSALLDGDLKQGSPVDTGEFRAAWQRQRVGYAHYEHTNRTPYGPVIEFGGYRGVGPKTAQQGSEILPGGIQVNQGIYPTQVPAAPVRRALSKRNTEVRDALAQVIKR